MKPVVAILGVLTVVTALTSGCGYDRPSGPSGAIAIVVGGRNNMPSPQLTSKARERLDNAYLRGDELYIVGVSGDPRQLLDQKLSTECDSENTCGGALDTFHAGLDVLINKVKADSPEADTLGAILAAARLLADSGRSGPKQIVVIDNGLQTSGDMPLQAPGALSVTADAVVAGLGADKLKNLSDVNVLWTGLGSVNAPQPDVPRPERDRLEQLWRGILTAGKAQLDVDTADLGKRAPAPGMPPVTPVSFSEDKRPLDAICTRLRQDQIGFVANKADIVDPARAKDVLKPVAAELAKTQVSASVIGTTAIEEDPPGSLSKVRAERVVDELVALGVPRGRLIANGVGTHFSGYVPPYQGGRFVETLAVQDRLVIISPVGQACP